MTPLRAHRLARTSRTATARRQLVGSTLVLIGLALAGCTSAPAQSDAAGARSRLANRGGFDPLDSDAIWSPGDRVTYRVVANTNGEQRSWLLELSLPELPPVPTHSASFGDVVSGVIRTRRAYSGGLRDRETGALVVRYSNAGAVRVTCCALDGSDNLTVDVKTRLHAHIWQERVDARPGLGLQDQFYALLKVDRLLTELAEVVRAPSLQSVLANGMRVVVRLDLHRPPHLEVRQIESPFGRVPAFWLPATLIANGKPALELRFLITWRRSPLLLTSGVLRIEAHHPGQPDKRVVAELVSARRGNSVAATAHSNDLGDPGLHTGMTESELLAAVGGAVTGRYRVPDPTGRSAADLVVVAGAAPVANVVSVFVDGKLRYVAGGGQVGLYLRQHGYPWSGFTDRFKVAPKGQERH